jgi:hypothetical protein
VLIASVRSCGSVKAWLTTARLVGSTMAPPTPMATWAAMSTPVASAVNAAELPPIEEDHTGDEDEPTADQVAKGAGAEDEAGDHKAVGAGDPQDLGRGGVQVGLDGRQSTDCGGDVDEGQHRADADDCQGQPAARPLALPDAVLVGTGFAGGGVCGGHGISRAWEWSSHASLVCALGLAGPATRRRQPGNRLSLRICLSKARQGTTRRKVLTRAAVEPAG